MLGNCSFNGLDLDMLEVYKMNWKQFVIAIGIICASCWLVNYCVEATITLSDDEVEVLTWAVGDDYGSLEPYEFKERWNELHSDIFVMLGSDPWPEILVEVKEAYYENNLVSSDDDTLVLDDDINFSMSEITYDSISLTNEIGYTLFEVSSDYKTLTINRECIKSIKWPKGQIVIEFEGE